MKIDQEYVKNDRNSSFRSSQCVRSELNFYLHAHMEFELVLVESGHGHRFIGDALDTFTTGDLLLLPPQLPHSWKADPSQEGYEVVCFQFREEWIRDQFSQMPECDGILEFLKSAKRALFFDADEALAVRQRMLQVDMNRPFNRWMCLMQCLHELSTMELTRPVSSQVYQASKNILQDEKKINELCSYLIKNYDQVIVQERVADRFSMSNTSLSRFFKKHTGQTFTSYIHELRIARACELLLHSDMPIAEIAVASGFTNISQFNRIFQRLRTITPRAYRKRMPM